MDKIQVTTNMLNYLRNGGKNYLCFVFGDDEIILRKSEIFSHLDELRLKLKAGETKNVTDGKETIEIKRIDNTHISVNNNEYGYHIIREIETINKRNSGYLQDCNPTIPEILYCVCKNLYYRYGVCNLEDDSRKKCDSLSQKEYDDLKTIIINDEKSLLAFFDVCISNYYYPLDSKTYDDFYHATQIGTVDSIISQVNEKFLKANDIDIQISLKLILQMIDECILLDEEIKEKLRSIFNQAYIRDEAMERKQ